MLRRTIRGAPAGARRRQEHVDIAKGQGSEWSPALAGVFCVWCGWCGGGWVFRRCPTLPRPVGRSTIGAGGLSFRVRDGTGRFPSAVATGTPNHPHTCHVPAPRVGGGWVWSLGYAQWTRAVFCSALGVAVILEGVWGKSSAY